MPQRKKPGSIGKTTKGSSSAVSEMSAQMEEWLRDFHQWKTNLLEQRKLWREAQPAEKKRMEEIWALERGSGWMDQFDDSGQTLIHWAAAIADWRSMRRLAEMGASLGALQRDPQFSALHIALTSWPRTAKQKRSERDQEIMVEWLIQKGLDVNARDKWGRTTAHLALIGGSLGSMRALDEAGIDWEARETLKERTPKEMAQDGIASMRESAEFELMEEMRSRIGLLDTFVQARAIRKELSAAEAPKTKKRL